ncbi:MAG TPA: erythromycin esterase family protein [Longimicrobium sp.]|nr:erythromycin esterase family protein [Longimicrobium sp.]
MLILPRRLLAACVLLAACDSPSGSGNAVPSTPAEWLEQNAHPISSISPADRDFRDLRPLRQAIGDARVVMLGEQSHGDGATFLAKARLIAFLHEEMGFDVLVWESGMYDVERVWAQIAAGEDVITASRRGIFGIWTGSEQVLATLDYVASRTRAARPLEMAGFDMQLTTDGPHDSLGINLGRLAREIGSPVADDPAWPAAMATLRGLATGAHWVNKPDSAAQRSVLELLGRLRGDAAAAGGRRGAWWEKVLESTAEYARVVWAEPPFPAPATAEGGNAREDQMAKNLVWLANEHYRGRKIIVWAASLHIARAVDGLVTPGGRAGGGNGWVPMGEQVHRVLGDQMYAVGFTAARGSFGRGASVTPVTRMMEGSLEAHLEATGMPYAFIDLRSPGPGGDWLKDVYAMPFGYGWMRGDWTRVLDGMVYTRDMTPSTRATR